MNRLIAAVIMSSSVGLLACSKEAPKTDSAGVAQMGATRAGFDATTRVATIIAKDFAYDSPDTVPAGWVTLRVKNEGMQLHHATLVRIDSGKTYADIEAALRNPGPPPAWAIAVGGPNAPDPGAEANATMKLDAGLYALICFVDLGDHVPHFAKGMVRPLVVVPATGTPASEPVADVTISLTDYAYDIDKPLAAGKHTIRLVNQGPQEHEVEVVRLAPGKTFKDLTAWFQKPEGPPPASAVGGVAALRQGAPANYFDVDLTPGNYVLLCFIADAKDKKMHIEHGMVKEFTIQ